MTEALAEPPWLPLSEAAERTGLDREAIRSRARRGLIPSRKGNQGQTLVQVPVTALDQAAGHPVAAMHEAMADLQAEVADLRVALARSEAERDAARATA